MRPETQITIQRPDGTIETVIRPGLITSPSMRRKMTQATRGAGRGEITRWHTVTHHTKQQGCQSYTRDQGCPLHGEICENTY